MHEDLPNFVEENPEWCEKVTSFMCKRYGRKYSTFADDFPVFALDACGITIWARHYRHQVGIVFNTLFWCTIKEQDLDKCDVILVYRGSNCFEDTWPITMDEFNSMSDNLGRIQAIIGEKDLAKNVSAMHRKRSKEYRRKVDKIESSEESELDLEDLLEGVPPAKKPKKQRKT